MTADNRPSVKITISYFETERKGLVSIWLPDEKLADFSFDFVPGRLELFESPVSLLASLVRLTKGVNHGR